ncbi:MAG TPA: BON domain-containing protein [Schlesneria sp.]|jgi:osmotically-inducible protein OsmY
MTNENCDSRMTTLFDAPSVADTPYKQQSPAISERMTATTADTDILSAASAALHHTGYAQLRAVKLYCHHGRIVLQGRIPTYFLKQLAQEVVRHVPNVKEIDNDLRVVCSR